MKFYLLLCFYLSMACCAFAQAPVITGDTMLCPNSTGTATVTGNATYTSYQWQVKPYGESTFTNIGGATSTSFTYDTYNYSVTTIRVAVTQGAESYTSNELFIDGMAFLGIYYMTETDGDVTFNPNTEGYVICNGGTITNTVGMPYSLVQWYKDGVAIAGATSTSYTITQAGTYYAVAAPASCPNYTETTLPCVVSVCSTPGVTAPVIDGDVMLCPDTEGTATVTNNQTYDTYQWQVQLFGEETFNDIEGATSATFTYGAYDYSATTLRLVVTADGETYTSNELFVDGYAWAGLTVMHDYDPELVTIGSNGQLLLCGDATVTNTVGMPYSIAQWYKDGEPIEGATATTYVITGPGEYYVVAAPGFCPNSTSTSIPFLVENNPDCTAGINNPDGAAFTLYPNPASTVINIGGNSAAIANGYIIYDVTGKTLLQGSLTGTALSINIEGLAAGSYLIKISGDNAGSTKMFIKE